MTVSRAFLEEVIQDLPIIRPIKEFIHLNLLLPYQHLPFWEALREVSKKLEARPFPDLPYYREQMKRGELPIDKLSINLSKLIGEKDKIQALEILKDGNFDFIHHDTRTAPLHSTWNDLLGVNVIQLADGMLIKWLSLFLDQGIGHWQMPESGEKSFYACVRELLSSSMILPPPFSRKTFNEIFPFEREEAIKNHLNFLCPASHLQNTYTKEAVLTLRGWAGLIHNIEQNPHLLPFKRSISLVDFLAAKLVLERAWIEHEQRGNLKPDFSSIKSETMTPIPENIFLLSQACQETLEESTYEKFIQEIIKKDDHKERKIAFQAVFCMDDRESLLRRFLENCSSSIETFGTAGHFGIECLYQHPEDAFPKKQCPAPLAPKVYLKDIYRNDKDKKQKTFFNDVQPTGSFIHDWIFSHLSAVSTTLKLGRNIFFPLAFKSLENVVSVELETKLKLDRSDEAVREGDLPVGYTPDEMAEILYHQLLLMGFIHGFAPLVFIIGHGSHTENNPYYATYGCGACSGRSGAANARALVEMANSKVVRSLLLQKYQLLIPDSTFFVAGFHDTCRDTVELYDMSLVPGTHKSELVKFKEYLELALFKNARERSKNFNLVSYEAVGKNAQKEVLRRSHSLFETRPELGHTNVAYAIVGRRSLTHGVVPNRPAFFQSYDPSVDPEGKLLATTLGAVIPVCSGINLDYYFSRVDNLRFGAGSKLPQNIVGNFGISHGTESDLLFGLPFQMIDQHRPLRLLVLVEQVPELALLAIQHNPLVRQIVYNGWIHYGAFNPITQKVSFFHEGQMLLKEQE